MNSNSLNNINDRRIEVLNVAISTDTILYTPFFLAYYSGDFDNTPFGKLSVNIIGSQDDARFNQKEKLKGDGFATFCLLFGLADAAICDPSYLVYLKSNGNLENEFREFEKLLTPETKSSLTDTQSVYKDCIEYDENDSLVIKDITNFKELFLEKKVIGGLISKIAFSVAGSPDLEEISNNESYKDKEKFGKIKDRKTLNEFTKNVVTGKFIYYKSPSTGFCIGEIYASTYNKKKARDIDTDNTKKEEFGVEISRLKEDSFKSSIAITCDFVSLDFILKKERIEGEQKIIEIEKLAEDDSKCYMFTGILGNCVTTNSEKLKALLYGIDKNLSYIHKSLKDSDTTGLTKYFKRKFNYSKSKEADLLNLLVADYKCIEEIQKMIDDDSKPNFSFDTIIRYYVDRLYKCKKYGGLYFSSTIPSEDSLKNMIELRYESQGQIFNASNSLGDFIQNDMLSEWRKTEKDFLTYEFIINEFQLKESKKDILKILASPILIIKENWKLSFLRKLWLYVRKPSYLYIIGSLFLIFEIISSFFHISGYHITLTTILELIGKNICQSTYFWLHLFSKIIDITVFIYFIAVVFVLIYYARELLKLKENDRYVYRELSKEEKEQIINQKK